MTNFDRKCKMLIMVCVLSSALLSGTRSVLASANRFDNRPGETYPIAVEAAIGTDFNITCLMNPKTFPGKNSTCLRFVIGRTNEELPRENVLTANSTAIIYMVNNASEQQTEYRCKCGSYAIMETKVFVGSLPRPVKDFACHSYDFDHMICNFTKPTNPIRTTYNVSYYNDLPSYIYQPKCNYDDRNRVVCNTSLNDRYQEMYHFIVESSNALVTGDEQPLYQTFDINNFEIMIPSMPGDNLRVESLTVDSIHLLWQMGNWEKYRLKGLQWEVLLEPENFTAVLRDVPVREHNEMHLRLNNLPYAFWNYKLKIRVRVKIPNAIWSQQFEYEFRTTARRPQRPPRVDPGRFYVDSSETRVTLYWEELLPHEYSGDNFTYVIRQIQPDGKKSDFKPFHQERNLAKFYWRKDLYYHFEIRSRNHVGESVASSNLTIYPKNNRNPKEFTPEAIHNVYHGNNGTYTLTWSRPKNYSGLLSFTVFWCYPKRALPNECKESMHFERMPIDQFNFTTEAQNALEERVLNLAVSANYHMFNTGLHWTDCSMDIVNTDLVKMEPELAATATSIKVQWSVERVCPSILDGFNITYCEVANDAVAAENATCLHNNAISEIAQKYDKKYYIDYLKPFTVYKVSMLMFWRTKKGQPSDPQIVRTLEGAPSPPRQLRAEGITNTTATIKWLEPTYPNGNIRKYIIMLNNDQIEVNASTLMYHLENLESFTSYKVYVLAETTERSDTSNDIHFTTAIGTPTPPGIGPNQNLANIIQWSKPTKPRGTINFYEVLVTQLHNEEVLRTRTSIITDATSCTFKKFPTCIGAEYKTTVKVRAVNAVLLKDRTKSKPHVTHTTDINDENDDLECSASEPSSRKSKEDVQKYFNDSTYQLLKSQWQTSAIFSCSSSRISKITTSALVVIGIILFVMATFYLARKKYNKMANIKCTLPAGLETYFTKDPKSGFSGDFAVAGHSNIDTRVAEDQWLNAARMHDFSNRNEHHHLLASLGSDSGYLVGGNAVDHVPNENKLCSSIETANTSYGPHLTREEDVEQYEQENSSNSNKSVDESNNSALDQSALAIFPSNNGYIKQSMLQPWQFTNPPTAGTREPTGYITVQNLNQALQKSTNPNDFIPSTGGYVMQQDLHKLFNNKPTTNVVTSTAPHPTVAAENIQQQLNGNGYTTLENLSKLNMLSNLVPHSEDRLNQSQLHETSSINQPPASTNANVPKPGGISGYVTQQDLNIFAQHQQNY